MSDPLGILAIARGPSADRIALVSDGRELSFRDLGTRAAGALAALRARGIGPGDRVALVAHGTLETVVVMLAAMEARAVLVPIHPRLMPNERQELVALAGADLALDAEGATELASAPEPSVWPALALGSPDDVLALLFTSGTSGRPKGALVPRRAFVASARASAKNLGVDASDRWLVAMPLAHVGGLNVITRSLVGAQTVVLEPRFDPDRALDLVARGEATVMSVVPTMLDILLEHDRAGVLSRLRFALVGGAPASDALLDRCAARRVHALTTYGLTEACSQVTTQRPRDASKREQGSGLPLEGVDVSILDPDGSRLGAGIAGRIAISGPTMMLGYDRGRGREPDAARDGEGRFDTGDIGELDRDGCLHVHARRTDLVVTGGENVYPVEVEHALESHASVRRAIVFGIDDERFGQVVAAAVEISARSELPSVLAAIEQKLAPHKRPRRIAVVDRIELGPSGKIDRKDAVRRYESGLVDVRAFTR